MYKIFADDTLIYDSTLEDYKIGKGSVSLETNKSGSFTFSIYPDHFYYERFVRLKTVITVYKSGRIVFRGRILNDVTDHWNNKVITCEGELGFLQDSIIRPFTFNGTPENLFKKFIEEHNAQVDEFKRFKVGTVTVVDPNNYIARSNSGYESALSNLNSRLIEDSLGGYFFITHGDDGTDPIPTINYLADFTKVSSQIIEFGSNLKKYTKTVKAEDLATAIIPLGHEVDDGDEETENKKLTIASVNGGVDYVYSEEGVALYGWIFKVVPWDDVTDAANLKVKAEAQLKTLVAHNITIELTAIDLHLIDPTVETFNLNDYIRVVSKPHNFDSTLLCNKQTLDLLKPDNDTLTIGYTYSSFTQSTASDRKSVQNSIQTINTEISKANSEISKTVSKIEQTEESILLSVSSTYATKSALEEIESSTESKIEQEKDSILLSVSSTYATKTELETVESSTESKIDLQKESILLSVSSTYATKSALEEIESYAELNINTLYTQIGLRVYKNDFDKLTNRVTDAEAEISLKIDRDENDQIISMINASADVIELNSNRLIVNSDYFTLSEDGTIVATAGEIGGCKIVDGLLEIDAANITGKLTAEHIDATNLTLDAANITGGTFAGFQFDSEGLKASEFVLPDENQAWYKKDFQVSPGFLHTSTENYVSWLVMESKQTEIKDGYITVSITDAASSIFGKARSFMTVVLNGVTYDLFIDPDAQTVKAVPQ